MTVFNFQCFACQAVLRAKTKLCGSTIDCPKCGAALIVPDYSPPVSVPSGPPVNVFQPNLPITVDDDDDGSIIGSRRKRKAMSGRDIGSMFFTVLGAVSFVVLAYILLMQNRERVVSGQAAEIKAQEVGFEFLYGVVRCVLFSTYAVSFLFPLTLAIRGHLTTTRWVIMSVGLFFLGGIFFFLSLVFVTSIINLPESDFTHNVAFKSAWLIWISTWSTLAALGSLFGAAMHGVAKK